jgi:hypothetical protein
MLSEIQLKPNKRILIPNYHIYWTNNSSGLKGKTADASRKGIPHTYVDLPHLVLVEASGSAY